MSSKPLDDRSMTAFREFVEAQKMYGAQSRPALLALKKLRKAIGTHKEPPPGMIQVGGV
jgi:hypothetical protein